MTDPAPDRAEAITPISDEEKWLPVVGFEGLYEVSNMGRVRSLVRYRNGRAVVLNPPRLLTGNRNTLGYLRITFRKGAGDRRGVIIKIHTLVLTAFVGPRENRREAAHLNGNPSDNRLVNLSWVSHQENNSHKYIHGTHPRGSDTVQAKLNEPMVAAMRYLREEGIGLNVLATAFGISFQHVSDICLRKAWTHVA